MTDVGLQRAEIQRVPVRAVLAIGGQQGLRLDRVTQRGTGTVRLHRVDLGGREPGGGERLADDPLLGGAVGGGEATAGTVLVDGGAADDGQHGVAVADGVRETLDEQDARTLRPARAVGRSGERLAPPVR
ncbi:hypothetical protein Sgri01_07208 [Streptomyces griseus]